MTPIRSRPSAIPFTFHVSRFTFPLGRQAPASPYLQKISALLVSKMPPEQAVLVAERLGLDLTRCTLHREAQRQGLKAQERRAQTVAQLDTWEDIQNTEQPLTPATSEVEREKPRQLWEVAADVSPLKHPPQ